MNIQAYRKEIDKIDHKILLLLRERMKIARDINLKKKNNIIYAPYREIEIINNLKRINRKTPSYLSNGALEAIFKEIISASRSIIKRIKIIYLPPFTLQIGILHFGKLCQFTPVNNLKDVFSKVENKQADLGVVPVASYKALIDMFIKTNLNICNEILLEDKEHNNILRFLVIGDSKSEPTGNDKTSLLFSIKPKTKSLRQEVLTPFTENNIKLLNIKSKPSPHNPEEYIFFLDLQGHFKEKRLKTAINAIKKIALSFKLLGSYPTYTLPQK
jgi:chorismate mutase/prephenate dehydratase